MTWYLLAGLVALAASLKDLASKRATHRVDPLLVTWAWSLGALPFLLPLVAGSPPPPLGSAFWPAFAASVTINLLSVTLYVRALQLSPLSLTLPILAFSPAFMLFFSPLIVGEHPSGTGVAGVLLVVVGSYLLNGRTRREGGVMAPFRALFAHPGPRLMLVVAFLWSIGSNTDKVAVLNSAPLFYAASVYAAIAAAMTPLVLWRVPRPWGGLGGSVVPLLAIGGLSAMEIGAQMVAIAHLQAPYVIAIKRCSILLGVIWGGWLLKEEGIGERLGGAALMLAGAVVIILS